MQIVSGIQMDHSPPLGGSLGNLASRRPYASAFSHISICTIITENLIFATDKKLPRYSNSSRMEVAYVSGPAGDFPIFLLAVLAIVALALVRTLKRLYPEQWFPSGSV